MADNSENFLQVSSLSTGWKIQNLTDGRRGVAAGGAAAMADIPSYLTASGSLKPVAGVIAEQRAGLRRGEATGVPAAEPLRLSVPKATDEPLIAVARHESGALTFHLPSNLAPAALRRRGAAGASASAGGVIVFEIPAVPSDAVITSEVRARRGLISKIVKVVVMKVIGAIARPVLGTLARRLEERLWQRAKRIEGWVRVTRDALASGAPLQMAVPNLNTGQRGLLLIHGTFSNTLSAFGSLAADGFFDAVGPLYGNEVYGFDHFTISKSPEQNVKDMIAALPRGGMAGTFDVVTHSRGGLVLRTLARDGAVKLKLGRAVLVASPNQGTPLATPHRWEQTVGWFANLMEMFPENPFTTAAEWVAESLSWLSQNLLRDDVLPGIASMDGRGDIIKGLRDVQLPAASTYAITANYEPTDNLVARLADMGVDAFFESSNDLVVPTAGGWDLGRAGPDNDDIAAGQIGCFGPGGNLDAGTGAAPINHLNFFSHAESRELIVNALSGRPLGLLPLTSTPPRRSAVARLAETTVAGTGDAVTEAAMEAAAQGVAAEAVEEAWAERRKLLTPNGWSAEDALQLMILPAGDVSAGVASTAEKPDVNPMLLATYGSARVLVPFNLRGGEAGQRWHKAIAKQQGYRAYMNDGIGNPPDIDSIQQYGTILFDILFGGDVRRLYDQARHRHRFRRLNVGFASSIPWINDFPWELAYDTSSKAFLTTSDVRFVRNVFSPMAADNIAPSNEPLRILIVSAQPRDLGILSVDTEQAEMRNSFQPLVDAGAVAIDTLPRATIEVFHAWIRQRSYDVIHFIGHGTYEEKTQQDDRLSATGYLIFEDEQRRARPVATHFLKNILRSRGIRLVFLNACQTAQGGRTNYNAGVAPGLIEDGVSAVVANQYSVFDRSATLFAKQFYWCLAQGLSLGDSARESRIAMDYSGLGALDWGVPVLFARNPEAKLCEALIRSDVPRALSASFAAEAERVKAGTTRAPGAAPAAQPPTRAISPLPKPPGNRRRPRKSHRRKSK